MATFFEVLEIKHGKSIDLAMLKIAFEKIKNASIQRYYILTTKSPNTTQSDEISILCHSILLQHGCEMIVNGVMPTLNYYLRLLPNLDAFINRYTTILQIEFASGSIKSAHLQMWQTLINEPMG